MDSTCGRLLVLLMILHVKSHGVRCNCGEIKSQLHRVLWIYADGYDIEAFSLMDLDLSTSVVTQLV